MNKEKLENILKTECPTKFMAFIRIHLEAINEALEKQLLRREVLEVIHKCGYQVSLDTLDTTLLRARKKVGSTQMGKEKMGKDIKHETNQNIKPLVTTSHNPIGTRESRDAHAAQYTNAPTKNLLLERLLKEQKDNK